MPKVLRIINRFNLGGPTYNAAYLTKFLSDEFETMLVGGVPDHGEANSHHILEKYGITPKIIPELQRSINPLADRKAYQKLRAEIRAFQPDIVHTHASKAGALGRKAALKENVPIILHTFHGHVFHSYFGQLKTFLYKSIERNLARRTSGIIAISKEQQKELTEDYKITSPDKCFLVPLGFDLKRFEKNKEELRGKMRLTYSLSDKTVTIGIIGRLTPIKDHDFFLRAIAKLLKNNTDLPKIKVMIIGDGAIKNDLMILAESIEQQLKTSDIFEFTSWITDLESVIHGLDIVALSSKNEGTPVSIIEAMAAGKPVISTDVGGVQDIITEDKSGFIIPVNDIDLYVKQLKNLIVNPEKRKEMGEKGNKYALENHHYTRLVRDVENLYNHLLNQGK